MASWVGPRRRPRTCSSANRLWRTPIPSRPPAVGADAAEGYESLGVERLAKQGPQLVG